MSERKRSHEPLKVTAHLASPLAGDSALRLDGLLEYALSLSHRNGVPGYKITRDGAPPTPGAIPIPLARRWVAIGRSSNTECRVERYRYGEGCPQFDSDMDVHLVGACSDAILPTPAAEFVEHFNKRIGVEHAAMLHPDARVVVSTTNSWTKSYRLPLRVRVIDRMVWFAFGSRKEIPDLLNREVRSLGKKISYGYGRVREWTVERIDADLSWFAPSDHGPVLMATLPKGPWLPAGLIGYREDYCAVSPPYWHLSRRAEAVSPV